MASEELPLLSSGEHRLYSLKAGESQVELMAKRLEERRDRRLPITHAARTAFLETCHQLACDNDYENKNKILVRDLRAFHSNIKQKVEDSIGLFVETRKGFTRLLGFPDTDETLLLTLNKALQVLIDIDALGDSEWFEYEEFVHYHTKHLATLPWMRYSSSNALSIVLMFYIFTPIFFCLIVGDANVCPADADGPGWLTSLYFASATLSTVGYGDITVDQENPGGASIGTLYMLISIVVAITAFSAAADDAFSPLEQTIQRFTNAVNKFVFGKAEDDLLLYERTSHMYWTRIIEIYVQFMIFCLLGVFVTQTITDQNDETKWTWGESFYWSIQTITTIGYGDMSIDLTVSMKFFQIFYLTVGTYFVGNALGRLATLKSDIAKLTSLYVWEKRAVNKHMIHYMQSFDGDHTIDQYEFAVSTLVNLGKVSLEDLKPIMNKYRSLVAQSGDDNGLISLSRVAHQTTEMDTTEYDQV